MSDADERAQFAVNLFAAQIKMERAIADARLKQPIGENMSTAREVAEWMAAEVRRRGYLPQREAVGEIVRRFGEKFVHPERKHLAINDDVLDTFRVLTEEDVVWVKRPAHWRLRQDTDTPGRREQKLKEIKRP